MKLPNKVITYNESIISKFPMVLSLLTLREYGAKELYYELKVVFRDINDYLDVLDCLFALGKININKETRRLYYVS